MPVNATKVRQKKSPVPPLSNQSLTVSNNNSTTTQPNDIDTNNVINHTNENISTNGNISTDMSTLTLIIFSSV